MSAPFAKAFNTQDLMNRIMPGAGQTGTSIFDPVLTELLIRWFSPLGGSILDPFAGGSVRGIVAAKLGRKYAGVDLREEQCAANRLQADMILAEGDPKPIWISGDSREALPGAPGGPYDMILTCPPYGDLETYSLDPRDISNFTPDKFDEACRQIIAAACARLKPDRFAAIVIGDYRDEAGFYQNFPGKTVSAFEAAGLRLYNEAILLTAIGSLPIRAGKQFSGSRKFGKTHQNVLIFCKGDPKAATAACGMIDISTELFPEADDGLSDGPDSA